MGKNIQTRKQNKLEAKQSSPLAATAKLRLARVSAQKARLVADLIRGNNCFDALVSLQFTRKKSARLFEKLLKSAIANAGVGLEDAADLRIHRVFVDQGPSIRRFRPRARGMAYRINKKTSHLTIELVREESIEQ